MNPIPAIRLILAVLLISSIFFAGWLVRGWKADSDIADIHLAHQAEREAQLKAAQEAVTAIQETGREASKRYEAAIRDMSDSSDKLRKDLRNAESKARKSGAPVCNLDTEWVRIYNQAMQAASDPGTSTGKPAESPQGANPPNAGSVSLDQWDVAWVHTENAERWAQCRAQLNALIDFETNDAKGVVTQ